MEAAAQEAAGVVSVRVLCVPYVEGLTSRLSARPAPGWGSRDSGGEWEGVALACAVTQERGGLPDTELRVQSRRPSRC